MSCVPAVLTFTADRKLILERQNLPEWAQIRPVAMELRPACAATGKRMQTATTALQPGHPASGHLGVRSLARWARSSLAAPGSGTAARTASTGGQRPLKSGRRERAAAKENLLSSEQGGLSNGSNNDFRKPRLALIVMH